MLSRISELDNNIPDCDIIKKLLCNIWREFIDANSSKVTQLNDNIQKNGDAIIEVGYIKQDEPLANLGLILKLYSDLVVALDVLWIHLERGNFRESWDEVQISIGAIESILAHIKNPNLFALDALENQLLQLEKLYPFRMFTSIEAIIERATCSICGQSVYSPNCTHISGKIYWGKHAYGIVEKFVPLGVALTKNPADKRCFIPPIEGELNYYPLECLMEKIDSRVRDFDVVESIQKTPFTKFSKIGRNEKCPCRSGKKFKDCCLRKGYIENPHMIIEFKDLFNPVEVWE